MFILSHLNISPAMRKNTNKNSIKNMIVKNMVEMKYIKHIFYNQKINYVSTIAFNQFHNFYCTSTMYY